jgi:CubicO group peptidase (beta-lactamase class C family)
MNTFSLPYRHLALTLLIAVALLTPAHPGWAGLAAQEVRPLAPGPTLAGHLESTSTHDYAVDLEAGIFVLGRVNQVSVDAVVTVLDPDGGRIEEFDGPSRGPEMFQFTTENAGTFLVRVTPFEEATGDYTIELLRVEPVATDPPGKVDQMMAPFSGPETPGVVVGVVDHGELVFAKAYGMANLEHGIPFTTEMASNIGSVTKHFTALGILLLEQDGRLSLADDVREHVPELPDFGTPITVKNLLNHTGGYREIYNFLPMTGRQGEDAIRRGEAIRIVQRQPELQALPNTEFNYNNTGYILLATIIERVSGKSFPEYMEERVFEPLGMTHTRVKYTQGEIIPGSAQGYVLDSTGAYVTARDLAASAGAGGIYTTVGDMHRWILNWRDGTVGGVEAMEAITTPAVLANGDTTGYGLGMGVARLGGRTLFTHTGGDVAHRTYFGYLPELEGGVFVSSNNGTFSPGLGARVVRTFFQDRMEPEDTVEGEAGAAAAEEASMPPERMEAIPGSWVLEVPGTSLPVEVTLVDGSLYAFPQGQQRSLLVITSDSTARYEGVNADVIFHFEADGTVNRATHVQAGRIPMRRVERDEMAPEALAALEGRYFCDELELFVRVSLGEDGGLVLELPTGGKVALKHTAGNEFTGSFPYGTVTFHRSGSGSVTGFEAANGRTKGVLFRRW